MTHNPSQPRAKRDDGAKMDVRVPIDPGWYLWDGDPAEVWEDEDGDLFVTTHDSGTHLLRFISDCWGGPCDPPSTKS